MKVIKEKIVFHATLNIEEGTIQSSKNTFKKQRIDRQDATAVLVLNTDTGKVILTRQFRYPVNKTSKQNILEVVAGKIECDESPTQTAIRETEEEIGYRINPENLFFLTSCFASPGYTTEKFHIYFARVNNSSRVSDGGGLKDENEHIELVEMGMEEFERMIFAGEIQDAKTYIAGFIAVNKGILKENIRQRT